MLIDLEEYNSNHTQILMKTLSESLSVNSNTPYYFQIVTRFMSQVWSKSNETFSVEWKTNIVFDIVHDSIENLSTIILIPNMTIIVQ